MSLYDFRIVEKHGRERVLAAGYRVRKDEGLRMIGALLVTCPRGSLLAKPSSRRWMRQSAGHT